MSIEISALKFLVVMGTTYRRLSHTDLSCIVSCVCISEQVVWCWWITETDFRCIKERSDQVACETIRTFLRFSGFFSKSKKHDFLRFFEFLHTFSRTLLWHTIRTLQNSFSADCQRKISYYSLFVTSQARRSDCWLAGYTFIKDIGLGWDLLTSIFWPFD